MENTENYPESTNQAPLTLDQEALYTLEEIRKWAFFLSIMGFIGIGILLLVGMFMGPFISQFASSMPSAFPLQFLSIFYLVFALIYFFPVMYLYKFSVQMKTAIHETNHEKLNSSFANLRSLFRFMGICTIIILSLYLIVFITAIIVAAIRGI